MRFIAILGDPGTGKTTLMTSVLYANSQYGNKIISNYKLFGIDHVLMPFSKLAELPDELNGSTIGMDELGKGADSYEYMAERSKKLTLLVAESRKRHCTVYFTAQHYGLIAKRLRRQVNGFILMEDLDKLTPHCSCPKSFDRCRCGREGYRCAQQFRATFCDDRKRITGTKHFDGRPWGKFFDTDEVIW